MKNKFINSCGPFLGKDMPLSIKDKKFNSLILKCAKQHMALHYIKSI